MPPRKKKTAEAMIADAGLAALVPPEPAPAPEPEVEKAPTIDRPPEPPRAVEPETIYGVPSAGLLPIGAPVYSPAEFNSIGTPLEPLPRLEIEDLDHALHFVARVDWDGVARTEPKNIPSTLPEHPRANLGSLLLTMWPKDAAIGQDEPAPYLLVGDWVVFCVTTWEHQQRDERHTRRVAAMKGISENGPEFEELCVAHQQATPAKPVRHVVALNRQSWHVVGPLLEISKLIDALLPAGMDSDRFEPRSPWTCYGVTQGPGLRAVKERFHEAFWNQYRAKEFLDALPWLVATRTSGCPTLSQDDGSSKHAPRFVGTVEPQGLKLGNGPNATVTGQLKGRGVQHAEAALREAREVVLAKPVGAWVVCGEGVEVSLIVPEKGDAPQLRVASQTKKRGDLLSWDTRLALELGDVLSAQVAREAIWSIAADDSVNTAKLVPWVEPAELDGKVVRKVGEQLTFADVIRGAAT